jgi:hypothetical protein
MTRSFHPAWHALSLTLLLATSTQAADSLPVLVEIHEQVDKAWKGDPLTSSPTQAYHAPGFAFPDLPTAYGASGVVIDRKDGVALHARVQLDLPAGDYRLLLRSRNLARLLVDGQTLAETPVITRNSSGHEPVPAAYISDDPRWHPLSSGARETIVPAPSQSAPGRLLNRNEFFSHGPSQSSTRSRPAGSLPGRPESAT